MSPEDEIAEVAQLLLNPAGDHAFATLDAVLANHEAFVRACHDTWKALHVRAIRRLLVFEGFLQREKDHPLGPPAKAFGEYNRAVWRRVNDAIVWSVLGLERHRVKRLCLYRRRPNLVECNPDSVMEALAELNNDPLSLALWNDATSCVDIGDIMLIRDGRVPTPAFIELKAGAMNAEIADILKCDPASQTAAVSLLRERHGEKAVKQFGRMQRQMQTANQALELLQKEKGVDPVTGHAISVVESAVPAETYDDALRDLLERALDAENGILECIDGCLWIYAAPRGRRGAGKSAQAFVGLLEQKSTWFSGASGARSAKGDRDRIANLSAGIHYPLAKPLYFRGLRPTQSASITMGAFCDNVLLYLDWDGFGDLISKAGGQLHWGSGKQAGRARAMHPMLRPSLVRGRLPLVRVNGTEVMVMDPNFVQLFYDGTRPWTLAQWLVEDRHGSTDKQ